MKILIALLAAVFVFAGCSEHKSSEAQAISDIHNRSHSSYTNCLYTTPDHSKHLKLGKYLADIRGIDTTACPKDFRLAWSDYVFAIQERCRLHGDIGDLIELFSIKYTVDAVHTINKDAEKSREADEKIATAGHELKRLAIKYGAM